MLDVNESFAVENDESLFLPFGYGDLRNPGQLGERRPRNLRALQASEEPTQVGASRAVPISGGGNVPAARIHQQDWVAERGRARKLAELRLVKS